VVTLLGLSHRPRGASRSWCRNCQAALQNLALRVRLHVGTKDDEQPIHVYLCVCVCCVVCVVCVCVCVCVLYLFLDTGFTFFFCGFNKVVYFFETHSRRFHVPVKCVSNMCKALASMCGLQVRTCFSFCLCYICTHGRGVLASLCGLQTRTFLVCVCIQECKQTHGESACDHVQAAKTKLICLFACGERERERESLYVRV
jgi:hypothetical protein